METEINETLHIRLLISMSFISMTHLVKYALPYTPQPFYTSFVVDCLIVVEFLCMYDLYQKHN